MLEAKELDLRNTYNPNLNDIQESAERTYGEANAFFEKEECYLRWLLTQMSEGKSFNEKDIYDKCHAIASDLAKCCEMYLKAMYIHEQNIPSNQIKDLWNKLKNTDYKMDEKGNLIYENSKGEMTFAKYDGDGNPIKDSESKIIYYDKNDNIYTEKNRGRKIKVNGHQLDRLIELLSKETKMVLETRIFVIPMKSTENNNSVSIYDLLLKKGILQQENQFSSEQYIDLIEQHKKTFEEARYSGQINSDVNIEFLYHLATQLKAVAQYKIAPKNEQKFTLKDEQLDKIPDEIISFASKEHNILSENLIKIILESEDVKKKIIDLFSKDYILPKNISPNNFYCMIKDMDKEEIKIILSICCITENYEKFSIYINKNDSKDYIKALFKIAEIFKSLNMEANKIIEYCNIIKFDSNIKIGSEFFITLFQVFDKFKLNNNLVSILKDICKLNNYSSIKQEDKKSNKYNIKF